MAQVGTDRANLILQVNGQQATSTLKDLKTTARDLQRALTNLDPNSAEFARLSAELRGVNQQISNITSQFRNARTESTTAFGSIMQNIAAAAVGFFGLRELVRGVFRASEVASEIEATRLALETIIGSKREADKVVGEIIKLAASTPFETKELIEYTKRLLAMGVETNKVIPSMKALGDVAAGVGKDKLDQLVLAYGQVAAKTKLAGGELKQFTEAGVPLVAQLAKQFKITEKQVFDFIETGKVGFKDVELAFKNMTSEGGKFFGLMDKQSQTVTGLASTLKDNLTLALAAFGKGFNESMKEILRSLIDLSKGLNTDKIEAFGRSVGNAVKFLYDFGPAIVRIISLYVGYRAAIGAVQVAQTLLNATLVSNPIGLIGAGIFLAVNAMQYLTAEMNKQTSAAMALNDVRDAANRTATEEIRRSNDLFGVLKDETISRDSRHQAFLRLQELYPSVLADYKTEESLLGNLETAHRKVNESILAEAFAKAQAQKVSQLTNEVIDLQIKKAEAEAKKREESAKFATTNTRPKTVRGGFNDGVIDGALDGASRDLVAANDALTGIEAQIADKMNSVKVVTEATNRSFVAMAESLGTTSLAFNRFDAEIQVLEKRLKENPADQVSKDRLEIVKKQKEAEAKDIVHGETKKKAVQEDADKAALSAAKKAALERLHTLEAETQAAINLRTLEHLRNGEIEKDFEVDLLRVKEEGLKKELAFVLKSGKMLIGEAEKKEAELLKTQRAIREKELSAALEAEKVAFENRQTALELRQAQNLLSEADYKAASLGNSKELYDAQLNIMLAKGQEHTQAYAKLLLDRAKVERQITELSTSQRLTNITEGVTTELERLEESFLKGEIGQRDYEAAKIRVQLEGTRRKMSVLQESGDAETAAYRKLRIDQLKQSKELNDKEIAALLDKVETMTEAEMRALEEKVRRGELLQEEADLAVLQHQEAELRQELQILADHNQQKTELYAQTEASITKIVKSEAEKQMAIERKKAEERNKTIQAVGGAIKDLLAIEIESMSRTTEERKKNAEKIKKLQRAELVVSSVVEIANIWKGYSSMPVIGQILAGIQTAVALVRLFKQAWRVLTLRHLRKAVIRDRALAKWTTQVSVAQVGYTRASGSCPNGWWINSRPSPPKWRQLGRRVLRQAAWQRSTRRQIPRCFLPLMPPLPPKGVLRLRTRFCCKCWGNLMS